jgi:hypothetical protein
MQSKSCQLSRASGQGLPSGDVGTTVGVTQIVADFLDLQSRQAWAASRHDTEMTISIISSTRRME